MKRLVCLLWMSLVALATASTADARRPVLVELFTAQGCPSCAKANAMIRKLADQPGIIALTWPVDYWDYLGWEDTLAQPGFTDRQRAYERRFGLRDVSTPQVFVDGAVQALGDRAGAIKTLMAEVKPVRGPVPRINLLRGGRVSIRGAKLPHGGADLWLIRYDPKPVTVMVKAGDNRGATVTYRNVVHQCLHLGSWSRRRHDFKLTAPTEAGLSTVVVLQGPRGGRVIAVGQ